jgi:uncharacterized protein (TIGR02448 family)
MKNLTLTLAVMLMASASALAYYPRHGGYHHGHGCYNCGPDAGDALTLGAVLGSLSVSSLDCSANYDCKQVLAAQDDAQVFIASNGEIRSAALNQALQSLREANPAVAQVSDLELAAGILQAR